MSVAALEAFTAAEMARCLNCSAQNVRKLLKHIRPTTTKVISSVQAAAWSFGSLPSPIIAKLARAASRHGFQTPLQLLQNPPRREESISFSRVVPSGLEKAQKLQRALARCFQGSIDASVADLARRAAPDYARQFGKAVSDRHLRNLIKRTIDRDAGDQNFARLELFLAAAPARVGPKTPSRFDAVKFARLDAVFAMIADRNRPTLSDIAYCWREILKLIDERLAEGDNEIRLKQQLRIHIVRNASFLGATDIAVKRALNRKMREAIDGCGIDQLRDGRIEPKPRPDLVEQFEADIKLCAKHVTFYCGKRESQAYRQLHEGTSHNGERFSKEYRTAFPFNVRRAKSRIPNWFRTAVQPMVRVMWSQRLGPHAARLALPSIHRDWSEVLAGDRYTSDDATLNRPVIGWHDRGEYEFDGRRFNVVRPQFLPVIDERSGMPLGFALLPSPTYNSWVIKTLMARICMRPEIGLPYSGWLFERSIWSSRNVEALASWSHIDESFARFGVQLSIKHATTPKAKIIEGVIAALQNLDEFAPGYIGRNEQLVKFERDQKFLQQLKRVGQPRKAEVDPREMFMTMSECEEMLADVMLRFANEPQNGKRLDGLSPAEGWKQMSGGKAHVLLPDSLRYLLATAESVRTVTNEGVELRIGRTQKYYCGSEQLGSLVGERVRVRFNPELPETIAVTHIAADPRGLRPFSVPLFREVRAHDATREDFAEAREHQNRFASYGRALYRELAPTDNRTISHSQIGSEDMRAAGQAHNRLEREFIQLRESTVEDRRAIRRLAEKHGIAINPSNVRNTSRTRRSLERLPELEAKILAAEQAAQEDSTND